MHTYTHIHAYIHTHIHTYTRIHICIQTHGCKNNSCSVSLSPFVSLSLSLPAPRGRETIFVVDRSFSCFGCCVCVCMCVYALLEGKGGFVRGAAKSKCMHACLFAAAAAPTTRQTHTHFLFATPRTKPSFSL